MKNKDLVSIIIPTYNRSDTILRSINSVIYQTYTNIEIIVVDDASTDDDTHKVITSINDSRLHFIRNKKNLGVAESRNIGAMASQGKYIAFNDSDDIWQEDKLEKQIKVFNKNSNCELCYCSYILHNQDILTQFPNISIEKTKLEGKIYKYLLEENFIGTPTIIVSRNAFMSVSGFNKKLRAFDDWELVLKISRLYEVRFLNEVLVHAYYSPDGITAGNNRHFNNAKAIIEIIKENKKWNKNTEGLKNLYNILFYCLFNMREDEVIICKKLSIPSIFSNDYIFDRIMEDHRQMVSVIARYEEKLRIMLQFRNRELSIVKIKDYLISQKAKTVAIYGYGDIGKILSECLMEIGIGIEVVYIVDKNKDLDSIYYHVTPEDDLRIVDMMIISIIDNEFKITEFMRKKIKGKIVRLQDII